MHSRQKFVRVIRLAARVWTVVSVAFVLLIFVGETLWPSGPPPSGQEWIGLAFFPTGVMVGLLLAWRRELVGGTLAIASLLSFYVWEYLASGDLAGGPFFLLVALPGLLYLLAWYGSREQNQSTRMAS